ncbi:hypothetical protein BASA50_001278 [Batrachochytrium salamandrivorans]|uniref:Syntaxin N-terminal domain-containing protein n=1 Tax=Batrachochytrium salamandrivorans TaxID=1357716 RepID=A0ABQ8EVL0_9FUNG|nr:hypothetical protein BASA50_001278 [Batrachochytrium salamandrivorans]
MVSLLAITVSAFPPYNPDIDAVDKYLNDAIQNIEQSQNDAAQNSQQSYDADIDMLDQLVNDITQNAQQPQDADIDMLDQLVNDITQNAQQPQDAGTQSVQQSPDATTQSAHQSQGSDIQEIGKLQGASPENIQVLLNFLAQNSQQSQDAATQSTQQPQGAAIHSAQQSSGATRSAQQSPDAATQNVQQPPDAATQNAKQSGQDKVLVEMNRLTEALKIQDYRCSQIDRHINTDKQRALEVRDMIDGITSRLRRPSLNNNKKLELQKTARDLRMVADELFARYKEQHQNHKDAITVRNEMYAELQILKGNQKLIAEHNSKNEAQVGLSPNSCYNTGILETQYDDIIKDIDALFVKHKRIKGAMLLPGGNALKAQSKQLDNTIRTLQHYNVVARRILCQHKYNKPIYVWVSESLDLFPPNARIE